MTNRSLRSLMISRNTGLALLFVAEIALISALIPGYFSLSGFAERPRASSYPRSSRLA